MKFINAQQAKAYNIYKNNKLMLLKTIAAIWFNKMCKIKANSWLYKHNVSIQ